MEDTLKKINDLLKLTNETFEFDIAFDEENSVSEVKIKSLKSNGANFVTEFVDIIENVVNLALPDYELVYNEIKGFALAKKVMKEDYEIESN